MYFTIGSPTFLHCVTIVLILNILEAIREEEIKAKNELRNELRSLVTPGDMHLDQALAIKISSLFEKISIIYILTHDKF